MVFATYSNEELNFLKFSSLVLDEFPKALRQVFASMWDNKIATKPGYQVWDDSAVVRGMFLTIEGGKTDIPTNQSFKEWDCTSLFKATIHAKTFGVPGGKGVMTLYDQYLKKTRIARGCFHPSVTSSIDDETIALAIDQLRLLRNTLCHSSKAQLIKANFDHFLQLSRDGFLALKLDAATVDALGGLTEDDFPTEKVNRLTECRFRELQAMNLFLQNQEDTKDVISAIDDRTREIHDLMINVDKSGLLPRTNIPSLTPDFTGRETEVDQMTSLITSKTTRFVNIWGPPGFGKTSTAIALAHHLQSVDLPVYYSTFCGKNSKEEFVSKLLSIFDCRCESSANCGLTSSDRLLYVFQKIPRDFVLILDNLDNLVVSNANDDSSVTVKDELTEFIEEILRSCRYIKLISTTRECLEFFKFQVQGFQAVKIKPLDRHSSCVLICKLLSSVSEDVSDDIVKITGNVPLAIKMLCSLISDSPVVLEETLLDFKNSANILELLDIPDFPNSLRLPKLMDSFFDQLSQSEKEAFMALSVFRGFIIRARAAVSVIGGNNILAIRTLQALTRKSFLDHDPLKKTYSLHPLIRAFAVEKREKGFNVFSVKTRIHKYYLHRIDELNKQFLSEESMAAYQSFFEDRENFCLTLVECTKFPSLREEIFHTMNKAYFFVSFVLFVMQSFMTGDERNALHGVMKNMTSWSLLNILNDNVSCSAEYEAPILCSEGLFEMLNGSTQYGSEILERACNELGGSRDQEVLKCLCLQILSLWFGYVENLLKSSQYSDKAFQQCRQIGNTHLFVIDTLKENDEESDCAGVASLNQLMISFIVMVIIKGIGEFLLPAKKKCNLFRRMRQLHDQIVKELEDVDGTLPMQLSTLLLLATVERILFGLGQFGEVSKNKIERIAQTIETEVVHINSSSEATGNSARCESEMHRQNVLHAMLVDSFLASDVKIDKDLCLKSAQNLLVNTRKLCGERNDSTAYCYFRIGMVQIKTGNSTIAKKSFERARDIWLSTRGENDSTIGYCYHCIAEILIFQQDYLSALKFFQQAVNIFTNKNEENVVTAHCYLWIAALHQTFLQYKFALESAKHALDIILGLYGEKHQVTADTYFIIGIIHNGSEDLKSALDSHRRALKIRLMFGSEHKSVADSYFMIGRILHEMKDYISALDSHQHALSIRSRLFGDQHEKTADSYFEIGNNWMLLDDFHSAVKFHQRALDVRLKQLGKKTVDSYVSLGMAQNGTKDHISALNALNKALELSLKLNGEQCITTCRIYLFLGVTQNATSNHPDALTFCERALDIAVHLPGDHEEELSDCYFHIGIARREITEHSKSEDQSICETLRELVGQSTHIFNQDCEFLNQMDKRGIADMSKAVECLELALDITKRLYGEEHEKTAQCYHQIGISQNCMGHCDLALQSLKRALEIRVKLHACGNDVIANNYFDIGNMQLKVADLKSALTSHQRALDMRIRLLGEHKENMAKSYFQLGVCQLELKDFVLALESHQRACDIRLKLYGEQSKHTAESYFFMAYVLAQLGDNSSSADFFQRAIDIRLGLNNEPDASTAAVMLMKGTVEKRMGNFVEALDLNERAREIFIKLHGNHQAFLGFVQHEIGSILTHMKKYSSAVKSLEISLRLKQRFFGRSLTTADTYSELAKAFSGLKKYEIALACLRHKLDIRTSFQDGKEHKDVAATYNRIGIAEYNMNNFKEALRSFYKALKILPIVFGEMSSETAQCYDNIAVVYKTIGKQDLALRNAKLAAEIRSAVCGIDHSETQET